MAQQAGSEQGPSAERSASGETGPAYARPGSGRERYRASVEHLANIRAFIGGLATESGIAADEHR